MIYEYYSSLFFITLVILISLLLTSINDLLVEEQYDTEKNSAYECGFQPIDLNLQQFDIKYYVVGLLFLIFDVEIAFLIPFINIIHAINLFIFFNFMFFMLCFFIALLYEWKNGYLDWE